MFRVLIALVVVATTPAAAMSQVLDPDHCWTCRDKGEHAAAGAGLALLLHAPGPLKSWRDTAGKRVALVAVLGLAFELGQYNDAHDTAYRCKPGHCVGVIDLLADVAGAAGLELTWSALHRRH